MKILETQGEKESIFGFKLNRYKLKNALLGLSDIGNCDV
jgi:hypothetical protein